MTTPKSTARELAESAVGRWWGESQGNYGPPEDLIVSVEREIQSAIDTEVARAVAGVKACRQCSGAESYIPKCCGGKGYTIPPDAQAKLDELLDKVRMEERKKVRAAISGSKMGLSFIGPLHGAGWNGAIEHLLKLIPDDEIAREIEARTKP